MISTNQFKNGSAIKVDGKRFTIVNFQHVKPGKGAAFVRTRLRNLDTGAVVDKTFRAGEKLENVTTQSRQMTYLYNDGRPVPFHGLGDLRAGRHPDGGRRRDCRVHPRRTVR